MNQNRDCAKIGLVTVLYHSDDLLPGFFKSLSRQQFDGYHLYLIDNTPTADTKRLIDSLAREHPIEKFTYVANDRNRGAAQGNNQGIELSIRDGNRYSILLNNDIEFEQADLLARIYEQAEQNNEVMIVPKILFFDSRKIWMAGGKFLKWRGYTAHIGTCDDDRPDYDVPGYVDYAPTTFMLIANRLFEEVGLLDPAYFIYFEDTDFVFRAGRCEYQIFYMPQLVVFHKESSTTGGIGSPLFTYYFNRNRIYFIWKNFRGVQRVVALCVTLLGNVRKLLLYRGKHRKAVLNACRDGLGLCYRGSKTGT